MHDNDDRHILTRIIVLLLSLACLAESAARLPYPLRLVLLRILRWAEPHGRCVVAREAACVQVAPWLLSSAEAHYGNTPAAAFSLGLCFRMLALALANFARLGRRFGRLPRRYSACNLLAFADQLVCGVRLCVPEMCRLDSS